MRNEYFNKVNKEDYKGVNTIFAKLIHKIMFDIQNQPHFEWTRPLEGNPYARNTKLRRSYYKYHGHRTENYKTFKQFLEGLVSKGHLAKYVKAPRMRIKISMMIKMMRSLTRNRKTDRLLVSLTTFVPPLVEKQSLKMLLGSILKGLSVLIKHLQGK